ncbi:hypothetical protein [Streptomyces cyaneogriseus]|nr:hypothetical protein [Streptomyces cyaneogriseus]
MTSSASAREATGHLGGAWRGEAPAAAGLLPRITSYNACYTKL